MVSPISNPQQDSLPSVCLIEDAKSWASELQGLNFLPISRHCNGVAHRLAKFVCLYNLVSRSLQYYLERPHPRS